MAKWIYLERVGWLIILMLRIIYPYFTVRILRLTVPIIPTLKMHNSILWYEQAMLETDLIKRIDLYQKMDALVIKKAPVVVLFYDEVVRFTAFRCCRTGDQSYKFVRTKKCSEKLIGSVGCRLFKDLF